MNFLGLQMVTWILGQMVTWIHGYMDTWLDGYMDTWLDGYMDTWLDGYMDTWLYMDRKLEVQMKVVLTKTYVFARWL